MSNSNKNWYDSFNAGDLIYGRNEVVGKRRNEVESKRTDIFTQGSPKAWPVDYVNPITERGVQGVSGPSVNLRKKAVDEHVANNAHIEEFNKGRRERHYLSLGNMDRIIKRAPKEEQERLSNMKWGGTSKMGIISAHRNKKHIHYDIGGINPDSVFDPKHKLYDSVTSREMRFVYKHQKTLGGTVQWMQDGISLNNKSPFDMEAFKKAKGRIEYDKRQSEKKEFGHYAQRLKSNDKIDYTQSKSVPKLFRTISKKN